MLESNIIDYYLTNNNERFSINRKNGTVTSWVGFDIKNPLQEIANGEVLSRINDKDLIDLANQYFELYSDPEAQYSQPTVVMKQYNTDNKNLDKVQVEYIVEYILDYEGIKAGGFCVCITGDGKVKSFCDDSLMYNLCKKNNIKIDRNLIDREIMEECDKVKNRMTETTHLDYKGTDIETTQIKTLSVNGNTKLGVVASIRLSYTIIYPDDFIENYKDKGIEMDKYVEMDEIFKIAWLFDKA